MTQKTVKSHCRQCSNETNHVVLAEKIESSQEDYAYSHTYQITQCLGCDTKSFREIFEEIEHAYQISEDEWEVPTSITVYPNFIKGHRALDGEYYLPSLVGRIYKEVLLAVQEDALILAGLGLRGTVEAVCNDLNVTGRNLEVRISKLATGGFISRKDADRLHGIRFMGNDAAHEVRKPKQEQLSVALKIVEHLLSSVYILEEEVEGKLEVTINEFTKFEELLTSKLKQFTSGDELPIAALLGRDIRRVKESLVTLESDLVDKIKNGEYKNLTAGKLDNYQKSKNKLQHYVIA
ncbi:DUF4145 domain-containing protein [Vibrio splendidus]